MPADRKAPSDGEDGTIANVLSALDDNQAPLSTEEDDGGDGGAER